MSSIQFLGTYLIDEKNLSISVIKENWVTQDRILSICEYIFENRIDDLIIELTTESFINFRRDKAEIRFVGGPLDDYGHLHNSILDASLVSKGYSEKEETLLSNDTGLDINQLEVRTLNESNLIHSSLLPPLNLFEKSFNNVEVFFKPYESPGGDFYWVKNYKDKSLVIVGDCTGHGIQGAMVAMSVITLLKQYFNALPSKSIKDMLIEFYDALKGLMEEQDLNIFDVEIGLLIKDNLSDSVEYVGSGINLIHKNSNGCTSYSSRKTRLLNGKQSSSKFNLLKGDQLFLFSDGITDQFDAANKRKLGMNALVSIVEELSMKGTILEFQDSFNKFQGATKSLDDQTMLILTK